MKEVKQGKLAKGFHTLVCPTTVVARKSTSPTTVRQDWETPHGCMAFNRVTCDEYAIYSPLHKPVSSNTSPILDLFLPVYIYPGCLPPQYGLSFASFSLGNARSDLEKRLFSTSIPSCAYT